MNRELILATKALSITKQVTASVQLSRSHSSRANAPNRNGSGNSSSIKEWLESFDTNDGTIPASVVKAQHQRSDRKGPRPYPKLICRAPVNALRPYVPKQILEKIQDSPHYIRGSDTVVTSSDRHTSTSANRQDCMKKLHDIIRIIAEDVIAEASKQPPKQPPKSPPNHLTKSQARNRFFEEKRLKRRSKIQEQLARRREEHERARGPRN